MSEETAVDIAIIGAGVVGLSIALELKESYPEKDIVVFEQMPYVGEHASGRNSGVLHAGLYYQENSLKKKFCLAGRKLWPTFAKKLGVKILSCGKYIVAKQSEVEQFQALYQRAKENGADVTLVNKEKVQELNSFVDASLAFFSSNTAVVDAAEVLKALEIKFTSLGGMLLFNHSVNSVTRVKNYFDIKVNDYAVRTKLLINSAGIGAIKLRQTLVGDDLTLKLVKGCYVKSSLRFYNEALLYPLPEKNLKGLGVHTCIDLDGSVKFGPNAFDVSSLDYSISREQEKNLIDEVIAKFHIDETSLHADFAGIRTKIYHNSTLYDDFWIRSPLPNYIELCGIESPGLTSAPAIAKEIASWVSE